jgi:sialic acid synthase SpsE
MVDFIAEVSSNHNRDLGRMKDFISSAKTIGCTGVKFQLFKIDELFAPEILKKSEVHRNRRDWELPEEIIPELAAYTHSLGLSFSCTPFYLKAVEILEPYVDFYKIASYELLWLDLFEKCAKTGKPVVFSTGMATLEEISNAVNCLLQNKCKDITVLLCNSAYPTPIEDVNLNILSTLHDFVSGMSLPDRINIKIGYSDHTVSPAVIYRAVHKFNANFVEFHLDLDGTGGEYAAGHCWLPSQIADVIENVKQGYISDGEAEVKPSKSELPDREWRAAPGDGLRPLKHIRDGFEG